LSADVPIDIRDHGRGSARQVRAEYRCCMTTPEAARRWPPRRIALAAMVLVAAAALSAASLLAIRWVSGPHARAAAGNSSGLGFVKFDHPARPVSLPDLRGGGTFDLSSLAGRPIVMNFWSSTCDPCKRETPAMASVARSLGGKVRFVGIDTVDSRAKAIAFVSKYKVPYQVAFDPDGTTADRYGVPGLPVTFFLSPSATTVIGENIGALSAPKLRSILRRLYGVR
jgi:thiol-disulfide isomerase/thioredoxin